MYRYIYNTCYENFRSMTNKNRDIEKLVNFLKFKALQSNVRRTSNRAINPKSMVRRRNISYHKNINIARCVIFLKPESRPDYKFRMIFINILKNI